jgi:hypothetical protein
MGLLLCICCNCAHVAASTAAAAAAAYAATGLMLCICWPLALLLRKLPTGAALRCAGTFVAHGTDLVKPPVPCRSSQHNIQGNNGSTNKQGSQQGAPNAYNLCGPRHRHGETTSALQGRRTTLAKQAGTSTE